MSWSSALELRAGAGAESPELSPGAEKKISGAEKKKISGAGAGAENKKKKKISGAGAGVSPGAGAQPLRFF